MPPRHSRHPDDPLDPELQDLVRNLYFDFDEGLDAVRHQRGGGPVVALPVGELQLGIPADVRLEEVWAPRTGRAASVRLLVASPRKDSRRPAGRPGILHIHGGGFVTGAADKTVGVMAEYARGTGAVVVSVDYRLAPETAYPGALEDCHAALSWLLEEAPRMNVDPGLIAISGQSAGGGLAAALCLLLRDRGGPQLAFQHLVYPMLDDRTGTTVDPPSHFGTWVWTRPNNRFGWTALLGHPPGLPHVPPYAAPARAASLTGLPPTFLACGSLDLFLPEDADYARRLMDAGVPVELHVYPGATHGFTTVHGSGVARRLLADSIGAFRKAFSQPDPPQARDQDPATVGSTGTDAV